MVRDITKRYRGLPPRTPEMLFQVVRKFTRGAIQHYPFIQEKKRDVARAREEMLATRNNDKLVRELTILFQEFHFYLTCWLQIDLALYRLAQTENKEAFSAIHRRFRDALQLHVQIRKLVNDTAGCVTEQFVRCGEEMACVAQDCYWFEGIPFTVDETSLEALQSLYNTIMAARPSSSSS